MTEQVISTDVAVVRDVSHEMQALNGQRSDIVSTFETATNEQKMALFAAISDAEQLSDHLNRPIAMTGFVASVVEFADENGEMQEGIRMVIVDKDGKGYGSMSQGINRAIKQIVGIFGDPQTWDSPKVFKAVEEGKKPRAYLTLKPVTK